MSGKPTLKEVMDWGSKRLQDEKELQQWEWNAEVSCIFQLLIENQWIHILIWVLLSTRDRTNRQHPIELRTFDPFILVWALDLLVLAGWVHSAQTNWKWKWRIEIENLKLEIGALNVGWVGALCTNKLKNWNWNLKIWNWKLKIELLALAGWVHSAQTGCVWCPDAPSSIFSKEQLSNILETEKNSLVHERWLIRVSRGLYEK